MKIESTYRGPVSDLAFAFNHYLLLGDAVGEATAFDCGDDWMIGVPVTVGDIDDEESWNRLRERLEAIGADMGIAIVFEDFGAGPGGPHRLHGVRVAKGDVAAVCRKLMAEPGATGWGRTKELLDKMILPGVLAVARTAGRAPQCVYAVTAEQLPLALRGVVSEDVIECALAAPAEYYRCGPEHYMYDPAFTDRPVAFSEFAVSRELGLYIRADFPER